MRFCRIILGALAVLAICSIASATLDSKVFTLCERNLSVNLTPDFRIIPDQSTSSYDGSTPQTFTIAGTEAKGIGMLLIMDIYDETMNSLDPEALSQSMSDMILSLASYSGDSEMGNIIGNWSTVNSQGENVTVDTMDTKGTVFGLYGKAMDMVFWNVDGNSYAYLMSSFDQNVTRQIINTLEIN
jgi:hypothetical protein